MGRDAPGVGACGRDVGDPARRVRGRMPAGRDALYGLRPVLQAVRGPCAGTRRGERGGAQGRPRDRGRPGGQDHADRRPGHRGLVNRVPVCRRAAVRSVRVRGARFGHDAEHVAAGPCGGVRVVRRLHAPSGVRQSQDRRDQAPA